MHEQRKQRGRRARWTTAAREDNDHASSCDGKVPISIAFPMCSLANCKADNTALLRWGCAAAHTRIRDSLHTRLRSCFIDGARYIDAGVLMTPQAILAPEFPEGSVIMSSAFS